MSGDILERLRNYTLFNPRFAGAAAMMTFCDDMRAAADEIERLHSAGDKVASALASLHGDQAWVHVLLDAWLEARHEQ